MERGTTRTILGVEFFIGTSSGAVEQGLKGGLVVVPAAPALAELQHDLVYREALVSSDLAITDSSLMVLLWWVMTGEWLGRVSGLEYLKTLLATPEAKVPADVFWIMPGLESKDRNLSWLSSQGLGTREMDCYTAPVYSRKFVHDDILLKILSQRQPRHIIVCLGGGVQEKLGLYLRDRLPYRPSIHCIGAAIGFLTGDQVNIPPWADRFFIGWLFRCLSAPTKFVPRYWRARRLIYLMWKYREKLPELKAKVI